MFYLLRADNLSGAKHPEPRVPRGNQTRLVVAEVVVEEVVDRRVTPSWNGPGPPTKPNTTRLSGAGTAIVKLRRPSDGSILAGRSRLTTNSGSNSMGGQHRDGVGFAGEWKPDKGPAHSQHQKRDHRNVGSAKAHGRPLRFHKKTTHALKSDPR